MSSATSFELQIPQFTVVASLDLVDHVVENLQMLGFTPELCAESKKIVLPFSGIAVYPTMSRASLSEHQLAMPTEPGQQTFTFPAYRQQCVHDCAAPNLGLAITFFVNAGAGAPGKVSHHVGGTTYMDLHDLYASAAKMLVLKATLNDTGSTPVTVHVQASLSAGDVQWHQANAERLTQLNSKFQNQERIEQRLKNYSQMRLDAVQDYLDPNNKGCVHNGLAMPFSLVRQVTNCKTMDPQQLEYFQQACYERTPEVCTKAGPLAAALLYSTAVKYVTQKYPEATRLPMTHKKLGDLLEASKTTAADVSAFEHIWNNSVTSAVPAISTYTQDVAYTLRESGVATLKQVGEEQQLLGSNIMQMVQARIDLSKASAECRQHMQSGNHVMAQASFAVAHAQRLMASEQRLDCDCEDFAYSMRAAHVCLVQPGSLNTILGMVGTPVLCAECALNQPGNTVADAQRSLRLSAQLLQAVKQTSANKSVNCTCVAAAASFMAKYDMQKAVDPMTVKAPEPREAFANRDEFLYAGMKQPSGHCCRAEIQKTLLGSREIANGVRMRVWDVALRSMEESTSSTIMNLNATSTDKFDMSIKVGAGDEHVYSGMTQALVANLSGGVYADMLGGSGLAVQHIADRRGTSDFYNVICQLDGMNLMEAEHRGTTQMLTSAETAKRLLENTGDCNFYYSSPFSRCSQQSVTAIDYELSAAEKGLVDLLADTHAKLYIKPTNCILSLGHEGSCYLPCISQISPTILGARRNSVDGEVQHFVVTQKTPMLPVLEVLGATSINSLIGKQQAHIQKVLGTVNENCQRRVTLDHISTDIVYVHLQSPQCG
jgi:hypothetical protein